MFFGPCAGDLAPPCVTLRETLARHEGGPCAGDLAQTTPGGPSKVPARRGPGGSGAVDGGSRAAHGEDLGDPGGVLGGCRRVLRSH